jgi:diguanylate cyclase (GGDEF)-like protein/PAS domain S-box-containing protein
VRAANQRAETLFRAGAGGLAGLGLGDLFPHEDELERILAPAACGDPVHVHAERRNGTPFSAVVEAGDPGGGELLWLVQELAAPAQPDASGRMLDAAFESAPVGMALFNTDGEYVRVNRALCALLGRTEEQLLGRRDQEFTHPDDRQSDLDAAGRILSGELDTWQSEKRFIAADGSVVWAIANLAFLRDPGGRPLAWLGQFQDITEHKRRAERFQHLAAHDSLTGVANRRGLIAELERRLAHAGRYDERGAVLVIDLDGFKAINDAGGHAAGDRALIEIAAALKQRMRATDVLGRIGGDEFAAVLPYVDEPGATAIAGDLLAAVRAHGEGVISASCGIALYGPDRPGDPLRLLAAADAAMYAAKSAGRGCARMAA